MQNLHYLHPIPTTFAMLKAQPHHFIVNEILGYDFSGDGEFVMVQIQKTNLNTIMVAERLAKYVGIAAKLVSYAGLKDKNAVTTQWFCLHMPGQATPDFSNFDLEGVKILDVQRHNKKVRIGALKGNEFEILLGGLCENQEIIDRLHFIQQNGFVNYFTEQRFGHNGNNLEKAKLMASGEIKVKDRKKKSFYLSAARSFMFNYIVSKRIEQNLISKVLVDDFVNLAGSNSFFQAQDDLESLQIRLLEKDIALTAPLVGYDYQDKLNVQEQKVIKEIDNFDTFIKLFKQEKLQCSRRTMLTQAENLSYQFSEQGLHIQFFLKKGSYATALVRELTQIRNDDEI